MLCSEPITVTHVGATNLLGGVVEMLISPPFAQLRRKLCFQVRLEPMMAAQPCVAPLLEGIIEKLARLFCWLAASSGVVGGGGGGSTVESSKCFFLFRSLYLGWFWERKKGGESTSTAMASGLNVKCCVLNLARTP